MTPTTQADIDRMKECGYDITTIRRAQDCLARLKRGEAIIAQIREAFAGVKLGNGIGLSEARAIDDHEDEDMRAWYRKGDEKEDWQRLSLETMKALHDALTFLDGEGLRFHLPAFMIADIRGEYGYDVYNQLSVHANFRDRFGSFTPAQRAAVRAYLLQISDDPDFFPFAPGILFAANGYWAMDCGDPESRTDADAAGSC